MRRLAFSLEQSLENGKKASKQDCDKMTNQLYSSTEKNMTGLSGKKIVLGVR